LIQTIAWHDGRVRYIDQTRLPGAETYVETASWEEIAHAIRTLAVRGAPAIGVAAAMGVALAGRAARALPVREALSAVAVANAGLASTRPTAVNLFWALDRMRRVAEDGGWTSGEALAEALAQEAVAIHTEDLEQSRRIGEHGAVLIPEAARVLTHCNAGGLATGGLGTALAVLYAAHEQQKRLSVFVGETRPLLQGARLTAWELKKAGVPVTLMTDSMAGAAFARLGFDLVVVGADRIGRNGDTANKIGTYPLALLAREHGVPFYVAAPSTTFDPDLAGGQEIPIEERAGEEVMGLAGVPTAPPGIQVWNPAFDVTPHALVTAFITEGGVIRPPFPGRLPSKWTAPAAVRSQP
jgi:methylthioribose-1-phosphate isomerase